MAADRKRPVIFDVGNVLLRWDPAPLIDELAGSRALGDFIRNHVITHDWNLALDAGGRWGEACAALAEAYPDHANLIHTFNDRWEETILGLVEGTPQIVEQLHADGVPLYALTNFSSEKFWLTRPKYAFFDRFRDILVSGDEGLVKPDPAIFLRLMERNDLDPAACVFIDDNLGNVEAANALGMAAIHFTTAEDLASALAGLGLGPESAATS